MKTKIKTQKTSGFPLKIIIFSGISSLLLFGVSLLSVASSSQNFQMDFEGVITGSEKKTSSNFEMQSGIAGIETNLSSPNYSISTINLIPLCGNGILELNEVCDLSNFAGKTCATFGFSSGSLICQSCTTISTASCFTPSPSSPSSGGVVLPLPVQDDEFHEAADDTEDNTEDLSPGIEFEDIDISYETLLPPYEEDIEMIETPYFPVEYPKQEKIDESKTDQLSKEFEEASNEEKDGDILKTTDKSPVFIGIVSDMEENYKIILKKGKEELINTKIEINDEGKLVFEPQEDYELGVYSFELRTEEKSKLVSSITFEIIEKEYRELDIKSFYEISDIDTEKSKESPLYLGEIDLESNPEIIGQTEPTTLIEAYVFLEKEIIKLEVFSDEKGNFKIQIPNKLRIGRNKISIIQRYEDEVISDDFEFEFDLVSRKFPAESSKLDIEKDKSSKANPALTVLLLSVNAYLILLIKRRKRKIRNKVL